MPDMRRKDYLALRRKFTPSRVKLVIVAESPPAKRHGKQYYFYKTEGGSLGEPLFSALMDQICVKPETKEEGLRKFQKRGWLLVDAIYQPVNKLPDAVADELISRNYWRLRDDLNEILSDRSTPLILVKKNVCELLERRLTAEGFNVLNGRKIIPFPLYRRRKFREIFAALVKAVKV